MPQDLDSSFDSTSSAFSSPGLLALPAPIEGLPPQLWDPTHRGFVLSPDAYDLESGAKADYILPAGCKRQRVE